MLGAIDVAWVEEDDRHVSPIGAKGIGEIGITGSAAAVHRQCDLPCHQEASPHEMPITPDKRFYRSASHATAKKKHTEGKEKVEKVMHEFKEGELKSSNGQPVTGPQASGRHRPQRSAPHRGRRP